MGRDMIELLSKREIQKMRDAGKMAAELLNLLEEMVKPGVATEELDAFAHQWTEKRGAVSAPFNYGPASNPFPKHICTSVNEVVCHGIPNPDHILRDGDIVNVDVTPKLDGWHGDTSRTFYVGEPSAETRRLVECTRECLKIGIRQVKPGGRVGDIGAAIETYAEARGFSVVRDFVGHGIGRTFHTPPQIYHYKHKRGRKLEPGMCFTIEPMINAGTWHCEILDDGWTAITRDGKLSAQFEHTLVVTSDGCEVLTLVDGDDWQ